MAKAHTLQGTDYGINLDYPDEIVKALSRLWAEYKEAKPKYRQGNLYIGFPAKLVIDGEVARDEFPDWKDILKGSTVEQNTTIPTSKTPFPGRGRGRDRGRGRERSQQRADASRASCDRVRHQRPGASAGSDISENEIDMRSNGSRSDDANSHFQSPDRSHRAAQSPRSGRAVSVPPRISTVTAKPC